uniref:ORF32 n=1 Tax=Cydia pomonella granulosis virus TaxID=28289 RepID=A0A097P0M2_GVCP|nr:ORF32 [Cydia pomonella granulovirus]QGY99849.1 ORF32 [Cydia pomonella granulovirus]
MDAGSEGVSVEEQLEALNAEGLEALNAEGLEALNAEGLEALNAEGLLGEDQLKKEFDPYFVKSTIDTPTAMATTSIITTTTTSSVDYMLCFDKDYVKDKDLLDIVLESICEEQNQVQENETEEEIQQNQTEEAAAVETTVETLASSGENTHTQNGSCTSHINASSTYAIDSSPIDTSAIECPKSTDDIQNYDTLPETIKIQLKILFQSVKEKDDTITYLEKKAATRTKVIEARDFTINKINTKLEEFNDLRKQLEDKGAECEEIIKERDEKGAECLRLTERVDILNQALEAVSEEKNKSKTVVTPRSDCNKCEKIKELYANLKKTYNTLHSEYNSLKNKPNLKRNIQPIIEENLKRFKTELCEEMQLTENQLQIFKDKVIKKEFQIRMMMENQMTMRDNMDQVTKELEEEKKLNTTLTKEFQALKLQLKNLYTKYQETLTRLNYFENKLKIKNVT